MMRIPARLLTAFALVAGVAACAPAPAPPAPADTTAEDTAAIQGLREGWVSAYNAGNVDALAALYAEDAVRMDNETPTATSRNNIRDALAQQMNAGRATITLTSEETLVMGDRALDRGTYSASDMPAGGGEAVTASGRYLVRLEKQADGSWAHTHTIDNTSSPPPTAAMVE
jgi:uncharacterized protein (TIGR02246 family)